MGAHLMKLISKFLKYHISKGVLLLPIALTVSVIYAESDAMSVLNHKPLFNLNIEAADARYFIYINGFVVHKEYHSHGQLNTTLPVNHWMHPSENVMAIAVFPEYDGTVRKSARLKVELQVHSEAVAGPRHTIATLDFQQKYADEGGATKDSSPQGRYNSVNGFELSDDGDVWVSEISAHPVYDYEGAATYQRELKIPSALPLWAFFGSDELPDYDAMSDDDYYAVRDDLYKEYKHIESALKRGDIDSVLPLFSERSSEIDTAFYLEPGTTQQTLRRSMERIHSSNEHDLLELRPDNVIITLEENRKLVSLTRGAEGAAIVYNLKGGGSEGFHLIFRRQDGEWILTR